MVELALNDGSALLIRRYNEADLTFIYEIEALSFSESERYTSQHLAMLGQFQSYCFLVAQENIGYTIIGYCIGVIKLTKEGRMGHIISIAVHPNQRRRGIGIGLAKTLMGHLQELGATFFQLEVKTTNKAARKMYRKLGFIEEYILRNYYGDGKDAIVMRLRGV